MKMDLDYVMIWVLINLRKVLIIRGNGKMGKDVAEGSRFGMMDLFMRGIGISPRLMDMVD